MFESLYAKTFLILGSQLTLTWFSTVGMMWLFRLAYRNKADWIVAREKRNGELDLALDWSCVTPYFWGLMVADLVCFALLLFIGCHNLTVGIPLFALWSILTGIELSLCLVSVDENLGGRVLALTAFITVLAGLIGAKSGVNFSVIEGGLFIGLLLLIIAGIVRCFVAISQWSQRICAFFGVIIFTGYLLFDFWYLNALNAKAAANNWQTAMRIAIDLYLDIINLFLELLDLLSSFS